MMSRDRSVFDCSAASFDNPDHRRIASRRFDWIKAAVSGFGIPSSVSL
jgi:hypothetical protein